MKHRLDDGQIEIVDKVMASVLRGKTPAEKVAMIGAAHRTARLLLAAGVRHQYPDWDEQQAEVCRRLLGGAS